MSRTWPLLCFTLMISFGLPQHKACFRDLSDLRLYPCSNLLGSIYSFDLFSLYVFLWDLCIFTHLAKRTNVRSLVAAFFLIVCKSYVPHNVRSRGSMFESLGQQIFSIIYETYASHMFGLDSGFYSHPTHNIIFF